MAGWTDYMHSLLAELAPPSGGGGERAALSESWFVQKGSGRRACLWARECVCAPARLECLGELPQCIFSLG